MRCVIVIYDRNNDEDHRTIQNEPYRCPAQLQQTQNLIKVTLRMHNEMIHAHSRDKTARPHTFT